MKKYFQAPWKLKDLFTVVAISGLLIITAAIALGFMGAQEYIENSKYKSLYFLGIFLLQWLVVLIPLFLLTKYRYKLKWQHFGFKKVGILKTVGMVISSYLLFLGITLIITVIILYTNIHIPGYQVQGEILPLFGESILDLVLAGILIILIAPFVEELIFRGFLLRTIVDKIGVFFGSIISALAFAVLHIPWQSIIPIFILGLIINRLVINSKSLWPAIAFHVFNNAVVFTVEILILKDVISLEELVIQLS